MAACSVVVALHDGAVVAGEGDLVHPVELMAQGCATCRRWRSRRGG